MSEMEYDQLEEMQKQNSIGEESHLAIETSGHGALKENHWLDDGAYLMVKILNKLASACTSGQSGKVLTGLLEGLEEPEISVELRLKIHQSHPDLKGGTFQSFEKPLLTTKGSEFLATADGFFLDSLHDPVLPLNIEALSNSGAMLLGNVVLAAVKEFPALDTSALDKFVQAS